MAFPIVALLDIVGGVLDRVLPDTAEKAAQLAQIQVQLADQIAKQNIMQMEVNKAEAANSSLFVSGWRPFVGWVCACALAWHFIGMPIGAWLVAIYQPGLVLPNLGDDNLFELMFGMLGLGGLRTYEKKVGVSK